MLSTMNNFQKIILYFCITSVLIIIIPLFLMENSLTYNSSDAGFSYIVANVDLVILLLYCWLILFNLPQHNSCIQGSSSRLNPSWKSSFNVRRRVIPNDLILFPYDYLRCLLQIIGFCDSFINRFKLRSLITGKVK